MEHRYIMRIARYAAVFFILMAIASIANIFYNSLQSGEVSNERSSELAEQVKPIVDPEEKVDDILLHKLVRKTAHGLEFAMFGISLAGLSCCIYLCRGRKYISIFLFTSLATAVADEYIQSFNSRTSLVSDVVIDFCGAAAGLIGTAALILIASAVCRCIKKRKP